MRILAATSGLSGLDRDIASRATHSGPSSLGSFGVAAAEDTDAAWPEGGFCCSLTVELSTLGGRRLAIGDAPEPYSTGGCTGEGW